MKYDDYLNSSLYRLDALPALVCGDAEAVEQLKQQGCPVLILGMNIVYGYRLTSVMVLETLLKFCPQQKEEIRVRKKQQKVTEAQTQLGWPKARKAFVAGAPLTVEIDGAEDLQQQMLTAISAEHCTACSRRSIIDCYAYQYEQLWNSSFLPSPES